MVNIPYIKIPQIHIRGISSARNIYPAQESECGVFPTPPPITYLTQWKIVGNSQVHTDPFLTTWKVSGNSVVDNNTILSCGDLGQDGKYHVKISNGVTIYDIPLDAPLRKVNDVADTIEFPSSVEGKALVTRNLGSKDAGYPIGGMILNKDQVHYRYNITLFDKKGGSPIVLTPGYTTSKNPYVSQDKGISCGFAANNKSISFYNDDYCQSDSADAFRASLQGNELIYELETPITELIDAPQIAVSPTYTSANETPYSAFEHTENKEIWSCGEYNSTDGKYHILVQPQGGSIADIALTEPLRKVNSVADTIEFPSGTEGKALVTIRVEENGGELSPLVTPTTELIDAPQIEEADSYTCVISQGGKAVSWSEFLDTLNYLLTDSENNLLVDSENYKLTVQN